MKIPIPEELVKMLEQTQEDMTAIRELLGQILVELQKGNAHG